MSSKNYDGPIIDVHMHLWDLENRPDGVFYPWLKGSTQDKSHMGGDLDSIRKNYLLEDYLADIKDLNVIKSVHVQAECGDDKAETTWLANVAKNGQYPHAIVARANLADENIEDILAHHSKHSSVKGVRHLLNWDDHNEGIRAADRDYLKDERWNKNFALLEKYNLSFDLHGWYTQFDDAIQLIKQHPKTQFILDHTGLPKGYLDPSEDALQGWRNAMTKISKYPNVAVKLSGLSMTHHNVTVDTFKPLIVFTVQTFGVDRCMFASNFPVDKMQGSYKNLLTVIKESLQDFSYEDQKKIFHDNAIKIYRLDA